MAEQAKTVEAYLKALPPDRRTALEAVRKAILKKLPKGYQEEMVGTMPAYVIPLSRYPKTYNKQPLMLAALGSQKSHMAVYLMAVYGDAEREAWFRKAYAATGKKLDMGKSCVRFKSLDDLPVELIGEAVARVPVDDYIAHYEKSRAKG